MIVSYYKIPIHFEIHARSLISPNLKEKQKNQNIYQNFKWSDKWEVCWIGPYEFEIWLVADPDSDFEMKRNFHCSALSISK